MSASSSASALACRPERRETPRPIRKPRLRSLRHRGSTIETRPVHSCLVRGSGSRVRRGVHSPRRRGRPPRLRSEQRTTISAGVLTATVVVVVVVGAVVVVVVVVARVVVVTGTVVVDAAVVVGSSDPGPSVVDRAERPKIDDDRDGDNAAQHRQEITIETRPGRGCVPTRQLSFSRCRSLRRPGRFRGIRRKRRTVNGSYRCAAGSSSRLTRAR